MAGAACDGYEDATAVLGLRSSRAAAVEELLSAR